MIRIGVWPITPPLVVAIGPISQLFVGCLAVMCMTHGQEQCQSVLLGNSNNKYWFN